MCLRERLDGEAAGYFNGGAADVTGFITGEEGIYAGDFFGLGHAP